MSAINRVFAFAADAEALSDAGASATLAFGYEASDGSPASGCVKWTGTLSAPETEHGTQAVGDTWETWGVPAGAIVDTLTITLHTHTAAADSTADIQLSARVLSGGLAVCSSDPFDATIPDTFGWEPRYGTTREVLSSYQTSDTPVALQLSATIEMGDPSSAIDFRVDHVNVMMEYTEVTPPGPVDIHERQLPPAGIIVRDGAVSRRNARARTCAVAFVELSGGLVTETRTSGGTTLARRTQLPSASLTAYGRGLLAQGAGDGNVKHSLCQDAAGGTWTAEQSVGSATSGCAYGAGRDGHYVVVFQNGGVLYARWCHNGADWSTAPSATTIDAGDGAGKLLLGCAMNERGVLGVLLGDAEGSIGYLLRSFDCGDTWSLGASGVTVDEEAGVGMFLVASGHDFVVVHINEDGEIVHRVSHDCGDTWL